MVFFLRKANEISDWKKTSSNLQKVSLNSSHVLFPAQIVIKVLASCSKMTGLLVFLPEFAQPGGKFSFQQFFAVNAIRTHDLLFQKHALFQRSTVSPCWFNDSILCLYWSLCGLFFLKILCKNLTSSLICNITCCLSQVSS